MGHQLVQVGKDTLGTDSWAQFMERGSADVSVVLGGTRCRINLFRTIRGLAIAVRLLAPSVHDLKSCNLHPDLRKLIDSPTGLVVISGPTGCGKSTTLAALIEELNASRSRHIVTLESPLEYLFTNRRSFIRQREIPTHSPTFEQAIIDALRENPDVLVMSEMRTPEVIRLTLNAAETGHLVLATMHSSTCAESLSPHLHGVSRRHPGQHPRATCRLSGGRGVSAAGVLGGATVARAALRSAVGQFRREGRDPLGTIQPDRQCDSVRRR